MTTKRTKTRQTATARASRSRRKAQDDPVEFPRQLARLEAGNIPILPEPPRKH